MADNTDLNEAALARLVRLGGDKFLREMIDLFLGYVPQRVEDACAGQKTGDIEAMRRAAHAIKSSAANLGAVRLQKVAEQLEILGMDKQGDAMGALVPELVKAFTLAQGRLEEKRKGLSS